MGQSNQEQWRLSDGRDILAKASGSPGDRSHYLWARPGLIETSNQRLTAAGSFIRLYDAGEPKTLKVRGPAATLEEEIKILANRTRGGRDETDNYYRAQDQLLGPAHGTDDRTVVLTRVLPEYRGPGAEQNTINGVANAPPSDNGLGGGPVGLRGTGLTLPSDCNKSARVIMGVVDNPVTGTPQADQVEVPVTGQGVKARRQFPDESPLTLVDKGGVSALAQDLVAYASVVRSRPIYSSCQTEVDGFLQRDLPRVQPGARVGQDEPWIVFQQLPRQVRDDFAAWSGIDANAAPEVGEALVTYRLETPRANAMTINMKAFLAMRDGLAAHIGSTAGASNLLKELADVRLAAQEAVAAAKLALEKPNLRKEFVEVKQKTIRLNSAMLEFVAGVEHAAAQAVQPQEARYIAQLALAALEITEQTTIGQIAVGPTMRESELTRAVGPTAAGIVTDVKERVSLWNKHWAGIVMADGSDYASLENDASTDTEQSLGKLNTGWGFALYGRQRGQSFHEQMMATQDFGSIASTTRYRRPV